MLKEREMMNKQTKKKKKKKEKERKRHILNHWRMNKALQ